MKQIILFTDLDGTLLDASTYSFEAAKDALGLIRALGIPLVISSSKTRKEIEHYRTALKNDDPFIAENGGGIFIPQRQRELIKQIPETSREEVEDYCLVRLGAAYADLRKGIETLRAKGFNVKGFGDMTVEEISRVTGLSLAEAAMARQREFDEPFPLQETEERQEALLNAIKDLGLKFTQGKFYHLMGNSDKGRAVSILIDAYRIHYGEVFSVALGDSPNDLPMLEAVDMPVVVRKQNGTYDPAINLPNLVRADGIGPEGWRKAVFMLLKHWQVATGTR